MHFGLSCVAACVGRRSGGLASLAVNAGEMHRALGYPGTNHAMPSCCDVEWTRVA